jgi:hypothetical protein
MHQQHLIDNAQSLLAHYAKAAERLAPDCRLNTVAPLLRPSPCPICETVRPQRIPSRVLGRTNDASSQTDHKYRAMCSPALVAVGSWLLKRAIAEGAPLDPEMLALWSRIDPSVPRCTQPDEFDSEGNCLTYKLTDENCLDSEKVR